MGIRNLRPLVGYRLLWALLVATSIATISSPVFAAAKAEMSTPAPGSTLTASTVTFQWTGGTDATRYWLEIGTTPGGTNLYTQDAGTNLSATVSGLPTNGSTLYVRLWSLINGGWQYNDYIYQAVNAASFAKAQMTAPAPGSTLSGSTVTFQWNGGVGVTRYWLEVGTTPGGTNVYGQDAGTNLSATVSGLPTNGSTVYVRLWSLINGGWQYNDYTYQAATIASAKAQMTTPAPGSTLTSATTTFQWTGGSGVSRYWLEVGTTPGGTNIYGQDAGTNLSATVSGLPTDGRTLYVRLWSLIAGAWVYNDYTYQAATLASPKAQMTTPAPGSTLTSSTVTFQWTGGTGVSQYWLDVGTTPGGTDITTQDRGRTLSATVQRLPINGIPVYVRLWSLINGAWLYNDYSYTAVTSAPAKAQMTFPAPGSTFISTSANFQWNGGAGVSGYWLEVGTTGVGSTNVYSQDQHTNLSATVSGLPSDGRTVYVRLWSLINGGWQYNDYTYTSISSGTTPAQMTSPAPGSTLTSSTVTFQWNGGVNVSSYILQIGTQQGTANIASVGPTNNLSATVAGLPTNGSTLYVRLWSKVNNSELWYWNDYTYKAVGP